MVKITLESAKNGLIKRIVDDNHGGSNQQWSSVDVYEETEDNKLEYIMKFFFDLCHDLGVNLGNKFSNEVITIKKEWGSHYKPMDEEVTQKIKKLEAEIQLLKEWTNT
jgi:hypothetical protein